VPNGATCFACFLIPHLIATLLILFLLFRCIVLAHVTKQIASTPQTRITVDCTVICKPSNRLIVALLTTYIRLFCELLCGASMLSLLLLQNYCPYPIRFGCMPSKRIFDCFIRDVLDVVDCCIFDLG
jgi:hypothetical protein